MGVAISKPHPFHAHMCLITLTWVLGEHLPNFGLFSRSVWPSLLETYTNIPRYIDYYVCVALAGASVWPSLLDTYTNIPRYIDYYVCVALAGASVWPSCLDTYTNITRYMVKCVHGSDSLDPSIVQSPFFWHIFSIHTNGKRCGQEGPAHVTTKVKVCMHTMY